MPIVRITGIGWVNWKNEGRYEEYTEFVRELLQFRKEHPILFSEKPFQMSDYRRTGYPDLSYHSSEAWIGDVKGNARAVGMMYSESYAGKENAEETFLYIGYNFYMGLQVFALPKLQRESTGIRLWILRRRVLFLKNRVF